MKQTLTIRFRSKKTNRRPLLYVDEHTKYKGTLIQAFQGLYSLCRLAKLLTTKQFHIQIRSGFTNNHLLNASNGNA